LRALGAHEPPAQIEIDAANYRLERVVKHDSWAATGFYVGDDERVVCKFNRLQPIGPIPMAWLGRWLARREARALRRLAGLQGIPPLLGEVCVAGRPLRHAVAHTFIPGRPLARYDRISAETFAALEQLLSDIHGRDMAYVDLHKRENILVGEDGCLYLVDFQIGYCLRSWWPANALPLRVLLSLLQRSDRYHLAKHAARCAPMQNSAARPPRPWWICLHRTISRPLRACRRWLLVRLNVRTGLGRVDTELFPEEVVRADREALKASHARWLRGEGAGTCDAAPGSAGLLGAAPESDKKQAA
jgi:hypothetical protein